MENIDLISISFVSVELKLKSFRKNFQRQYSNCLENILLSICNVLKIVCSLFTVCRDALAGNVPQIAGRGFRPENICENEVHHSDVLVTPASYLCKIIFHNHK